MLWFIAAIYNEMNELPDFIHHVEPLLTSPQDGISIADDYSTDGSAEWLLSLVDREDRMYDVRLSFSHENTGLPETVKHMAKERVPDGAWILMLDADERLHPDTIESIKKFLEDGESNEWDYVYFQQLEIIDGRHVRTFQKCKLFRKEAISFPLNNIHADDQFDGRGTYKPEWVVFHRKTSDKQKLREGEYVQTYKRLLKEGHIDQGRYEWLIGLHHYRRE